MPRELSDKAFMVWISLLGSSGYNVYKALYEELGDPQGIYAACAAGKIPDRFRGNPLLLKDLGDAALREKAADICRAAYEAGMGIVTLEDPEYPEKLKNTPYPCPLALYYYGDIGACSGGKETGLSVGIVGSRHCSVSGETNARTYSYELAKKGITVISGMARGCDGWAHRGAIKAGGTTAAVLASGADVIYPPEHKKLYGEIIARGGCVLSESPPGTRPLKQLFPARNRIIAGLSDAVIVIEAAKKSGALITADRAIEADRIVFALPGDVRNPMAYGSNELIRQGAICATDIGVILDELGVEDVKREAKKPWNGYAIGLPFPESSVVNAVIHGAGTIDEIEAATHIGIGQIGSALTMLELRGLIKSNGFGTYSPVTGYEDRGN